MRRLVLAAFAAISLGGTAWAQSPGSITIAGKQMGVTATGEFKKFTALVQFDPTKPAAGKIAIEVDTTSIDLGLEDFNQELRSKTWFDSRAHPKATFLSSAIKATGGDRIETSGKLTIKGQTQDVVVPATFKTDGVTRVFEGALPIKRTAFNVGEGEWKKTDTVADEVQIRFRIVVPTK
jgi:polyisoprenoid-binding protein YceI